MVAQCGSMLQLSQPGLFVWALLMCFIRRKCKSCYADSTGRPEVKNWYADSTGRPDILTFDSGTLASLELDISLAHPFNKELIKTSARIRQQVLF